MSTTHGLGRLKSLRLSLRGQTYAVSQRSTSRPAIALGPLNPLRSSKLFDSPTMRISCWRVLLESRTKRTATRIRPTSRHL